MCSDIKGRGTLTKGDLPPEGAIVRVLDRPYQDRTERGDILVYVVCCDGEWVVAASMDERGRMFGPVGIVRGTKAVPRLEEGETLLVGPAFQRGNGVHLIRMVQTPES